MRFSVKFIPRVNRISHNYAIPHAMPHTIPQTLSSFYPHRTQTGRIQIFDQLSALFIKTASSSTAKSFVKYCLVYSSLQCKKISYLIAARMTKNAGAFSLSSIAGSHLFVTQYNVLDILGGWRRVKMRKCLITEEVYPRQQQQQLR